MQWPEAGQRLFPSPHRAEPENLRRDIIDELADHLALAAEDEVVKHGRSPEAAWKRVLERFGNPAAVARRLWWDAMRERVMREWIQTGVAAASAVVILLVAVLVVNGMNTMQTTQVQLLQTLQQMNQPALPVGETLELQVRRGAKDGPPAEGVEVVLTGKISSDDTASAKQITDAEGRARFSPVPQGAYRIWLTDPRSKMTAVADHSLFAGTGSGRLIVAPDYEPSPVECRLDPPFPYPNDRVFVYAGINVTDTIDGLEWEFFGQVMINNQGSYKTTPSNPAFSDQFQSLQLSEPSPTILLPPRTVEERPNVQLLFIRQNGDALPMQVQVRRPSPPRSARLTMNNGALALQLSQSYIDEAGDWLKSYTYAARFLNRDIPDPHAGSEYYVWEAIPLDALTASVGESAEGKATLTVQPNLEKDGYVMAGGPEFAAVLKVPDPANLQAYPAETRFLFNYCRGNRLDLVAWTGSVWKNEVDAVFDVNVFPLIGTESAPGVDVTELVRRHFGQEPAAGLMLQTPKPKPAIPSSAPAAHPVRPIAIPSPFEGIHTPYGRPPDSQQDLPYLLVVSNTPPPDL